MKIGDITYITKKLTTNRDGLQATYSLTPKTNVVAMIIGITPGRAPTDDEVADMVRKAAAALAKKSTPEGAEVTP